VPADGLEMPLHLFVGAGGRNAGTLLTALEGRFDAVCDAGVKVFIVQADFLLGGRVSHNNVEE